jgi:O-antigen ligase
VSTLSIARWIALGALFLIPLTPLVVSSSLFFPFITGKAFFFRILVEVAFGAWLVLALVDRRYRPRFSWIEVSVLAFVGWMFIANLFAVNVEKAFWSNFERMEGWILLAHLAGLFLVASSVLRVSEKWRAWFLTNLGVSLIVLGYAFLQATGQAAIHQGSVRIDASFGNSIYLAVYLLFNTFIAGWLAFTEKQVWLKWSLLALAAINIPFIFLTQTRGTIIALVGALGLAALLTVLFSGKTARRVAAGGLVALLLVVGGFIALRDSDVVRQSDLWGRIASISLSDGEVRFALWGMAWEGFLERPIVGWGQEGFNYVFNKYYDPSLYAQEPWFDRAHNAFVDWLTAGGAPAFLLYIALFLVAIITLWSNTTLPRAERIALTCVIAGYAVHNFFVFDNLYSYVYFFAILALIDSQVSRPVGDAKGAVPVASGALTLPVVAALTVVLIYIVNVPALRTASSLIDALSSQPGGIQTNAQVFTSLAETAPLGARQEVREQLVNFSLQALSRPDVPTDLKLQIGSLAINEMKKQVEEHPLDARQHLQLSIAYRAVGSLEGMLASIRDAKELSPRKQQIFIQEGIVLIELGRLQEGQAVLNEAYALDVRSSESAKYAALGNLIAGDRQQAEEILVAHPEVREEVEMIISQLSAASAQ